MNEELERLRRWAERKIGRPVRLEIWDIPWGVNGVAWSDYAGNACIAVASRLLSSPLNLKQTFLHEVAHHVRGDCDIAGPTPTVKHMLEDVASPEYSYTPRERGADAWASAHMAELDKKEDLVESRTWAQLAVEAARALKQFTPQLRKKLDGMPVSASREQYRRWEVDGYSKLSSGDFDYQAAATATALRTAEMCLRDGARTYRSVCQYAGLPCPPAIAQLADGAGLPAPLPQRSRQAPKPAAPQVAQPVRPPAPQPARSGGPSTRVQEMLRQKQSAGGWEYADVPGPHNRYMGGVRGIEYR